jgi:DnaJ-class molecular chaperone
VTQDTSLLHRSIRDNIRYGRPRASDAEVIRAAKLAHADEFIHELEDWKKRRGYDSQVGERGVKLSGGQRQRMAIARVILKDAPILVQAEQQRAEQRRRQAEEEREAQRKRRREHKRVTAQFKSDWWIVLGVAPSASKDEIVRKYRHKIKQCHPDRLVGVAPELLQLAEEQAKDLNEAYANAMRTRRHGTPDVAAA